MQTIAKQERRALVDKAISFRNCQKEKGPSSPQWEENGEILQQIDLFTLLQAKAEHHQDR